MIFLDFDFTGFLSLLLLFSSCVRMCVREKSVRVRQDDVALLLVGSEKKKKKKVRSDVRRGL